MQHEPWARASLLGAAFVASLALIRCGSEDGPAQQQCDDWSNQASTGRRQEQDDAERACRVDEDCTLVDYGLSCFADCGYPSAVAGSGVQALEAALLSLDGRFCGRFESAQCPGPIIPPCVPPLGTPVARCRNAACALEWIDQP